MNETAMERWRWKLNREIAEYLSQPSAEQANTITELLARYRLAHNQMTHTREYFSLMNQTGATAGQS